MRVSSNATMTDAQSAVFGAELKRLRKKEGLSGAAFGELVGCTASHIYLIEKDAKKASPQLAERIADAFNLKVSDMLTPYDEQVREMRRKYGEAISTRRREKGIAINVIADALGIPLSVYKECEQGLCSIGASQKETLDRLLGINEEPKVVEKEVIVEVPVEIPTEICDIILAHVRDLQVDDEEQKKIWRYFSAVKMSAEERKLFG